jgi:hypothetical protein
LIAIFVIGHVVFFCPPVNENEIVNVAQQQQQQQQQQQKHEMEISTLRSH